MDFFEAFNITVFELSAISLLILNGMVLVGVAFRLTYEMSHLDKRLNYIDDQIQRLDDQVKHWRQSKENNNEKHG